MITAPIQAELAQRWLKAREALKAAHNEVDNFNRYVNFFVDDTTMREAGVTAAEDMVTAERSLNRAGRVFKAAYGYAPEEWRQQ